MEALAPWAEPVLMTADELWELPDDGWLYELVEGRLVRMSPAGPTHASVVSRAVLHILGFVLQHQLGDVFSGDPGYWISPEGSPDTVLAPDVAFIRRVRLPEAWGDGFARMAPNLVVEILSPSQNRLQIAAKARRWLNAGVDLVWVVLPKTRVVEVWRTGEPVRTLSETEELSGEEILPGFVLPVRELFS